MPLLTNLRRRHLAAGSGRKSRARSGRSAGPFHRTTCSMSCATRKRPAWWSTGSRSIRLTRRTSRRCSTKWRTRCTTTTSELWLCVQPGQELDYIDFDELSDNVDRFVALLFDETSDNDAPGPLGSRPWFEGWLHVLLEGRRSQAVDHRAWQLRLRLDRRRDEGGVDQFSRGDEPGEQRRSRDRARWRRRITIPISIMRMRTRTTPSGFSMSSLF